MSTSYGGSQLASDVAAGSAAVRAAALVTGELGSHAARKAQLTRQLQERRLQANMRGREIKSIDELLYNVEFPGHYMRRIKPVAVSMPASEAKNSLDYPAFPITGTHPVA